MTCCLHAAPGEITRVNRSLADAARARMVESISIMARILADVSSLRVCVLLVARVLCVELRRATLANATESAE